MAIRLYLFIAITLLSYETLIFSQKSDESGSFVVRALLIQTSISGQDNQAVPVEVYFSNTGSRDIYVCEQWNICVIDFEVLTDDNGVSLPSIDANGEETIGVKLSPVISTGQIRYASFPNSDEKHKWIKLAAGISKRFVTTISLNKEYFQNEGLYRIRLQYCGNVSHDREVIKNLQVDSNWILLRVKQAS